MTSSIKVINSCGMRCLAIADSGNQIKRITDSWYFIKSQSSEIWYEVRRNLIEIVSKNEVTYNE